MFFANTANTDALKVKCPTSAVCNHIYLLYYYYFGMFVCCFFFYILLNKHVRLSEASV